MKFRHSMAGMAAVWLLLGALTGEVPGVGSAAAQPATPAPAQPAPPRRGGYLGRDNVPDHNVFLPPPPAVGSPFGKADLATFESTRALANGPRWELAARDDRIGHKQMLGDFGCAMGVDLGTAETPAISRVIQRSMGDLVVTVGAAKDKYQRPRPFVTEQGPVCITPSEDFARSGSYPSGHAASGWLYALLLAEIDPGSSAAVVARGRVFGESRVVCGVHYVSDVEGGRMSADAIVAALHGNAEFEADVDAARAELAALRSAGGAKPDAASCAIDGALLKTPW